jgi:hypothetical protein
MLFSGPWILLGSERKNISIGGDEKESEHVRVPDPNPKSKLIAVSSSLIWSITRAGLGLVH